MWDHIPKDEASVMADVFAMDDTRRERREGARAGKARRLRDTPGERVPVHAEGSLRKNAPSTTQELVRPEHKAHFRED